MPRNSSGQELHPHRERADAAEADGIPAPTAEQAILVEAAEADTVAAHGQGVGSRPLEAERDALSPTRVLVVGQDEASQEGGAPEVREVMLGKLELLAHFRETGELLVLGLGHAVLDQPRNPEDISVLRGLVVLELPRVLVQVLPLVVAETRRRCVLTQRVARLDLPENRAVVAEFSTEVAPLGGKVRELRNRTVGDVREERALDDFPCEVGREGLETLGVVGASKKLAFTEQAERVSDGDIRSFAVHDCLSPKMGGLPTEMARRGVKVPNL